MKEKICSIALGALLMCGGASAADVTGWQPRTFDGYFGVKVSPDGKYIALRGAGVTLINLETNQQKSFMDDELGLGNALALNGTAVGSFEDFPVVMYPDQPGDYPPSLQHFSFCDLNAITADASRICGFAIFPDETFMTPFYCDLDENGRVGEPVKLPFPTQDFLGLHPQYVTLVWISDDGKTMAGQMMDDYGRSADPIIYKQLADGSWKYYQPSKVLFNPLGLEIPENPYEKAPNPPELSKYMDPDSYAAYMEELDRYENPENYPDDYPVLEEPQLDEFMSPTEYQAWLDALEEYEQYFEDRKEELAAYERFYLRLLASTPLFGLNEFAMNPEGTLLAAGATVRDDNNEDIRVIYTFDLTDLENESEPVRLKSKYTDAYPTQILRNGVIVEASPQFAPAEARLLFPGAEDFIPIQEYFESINPAWVGWMDDAIPNGSGYVNMNEEMTVFLGGVTADHFGPGFHDSDELLYLTYLFDTSDAGVGSIASDSVNVRALGDGRLQIEGEVKTISIYDLAGKVLFNASYPQACVIDTGLESGIYVVKADTADGMNSYKLKL